MMTPAVLSRARELVEPSLRKAIGSLDRHLRTAAEYHFGWVAPDGSPVAGAGGKAVRPALAILGAEAAGADASVAVPGAAALELIHNFSLIHDDIMDGDRMRRHRRTVWDVYGVPDAIVVGDGLQTLAFQVLLDDPGAGSLRAARRLGIATMAMIAGQAQDGALDRTVDVTFAECLEMERNKTGALLAHSVAMGAELAGADEVTVECLQRFGEELGLSFQAIDDVLGIWGDPAVTGKPAGSDLRDRKKSMPVAMALDRGGELAGELRAAFHGDLDDDMIRRLSTRLEEAGVRSHVEQFARSRLDAALGALHEQPLEPKAAAELEELALFVVERKH